MGALYSTANTDLPKVLTTSEPVLSRPDGQYTSIPINGHYRCLNVKPSKYSTRDRYLTFSHAQKPVNYDVDLSKSGKMFPIFNQGALGSCTANGICGAYWYDLLNQGSVATDPDFKPSRLYLYYQERRLEGNTGTDSGAQISDGIKVLRTQGVCSEQLWPYDISKFTQDPPSECDQDAQKHHSQSDHLVNQRLDDLVNCLQAGAPIVFGFAVYKSFEAIGASGLVDMPKEGEEMIGGHCVDLYGYDSKTERFKVLNSWGPEWGDQGYCYFPKEYILNPKLAYDFTVVTKVVG